MKKPLFLLVLLSSLTVHAAVYRGKDGQRTLVLDSDTLTYHYEDERLPFALVPSDGCLAQIRCYRTATGTVLEQHGSSWHIQNGAVLVSHTPPVHDPVNRLYTKEMPYAAALLDDLTFTATKTIAYNDKAIELQYWREAQSGLEHVLISNGYKEKRNAVNQFLRAQALATLYARRECLAALPADKRAALDYRVNMEPAYLGLRYISVRIHEQTSCGYGGHYGITYDIKQARGLELEDLLWTDSATAPHPLDDDNPADRHLREARAAWLFAALQQQMPVTPGTYRYRPHHYLYPYFYLTAQGLYLGPLLPVQDASHAHPAGNILPYDLLKKHPGILGANALP